MSWRTLHSRVVYANPWLQVREDVVVQPDGREGVYGVVDKPDFALVIPFDGERYTLVEQFRYTVGGRFWEFPMGACDAGEDAIAAARRELAEEAGLAAARWTPLGRLHHAYGFASNAFDVFLAEELTPTSATRDGTEADMAVGRFTLDEVRTMITDRRVTDAPTVAALGLLRLTT